MDKLTIHEEAYRRLGGKGSGHWGHASKPGRRGGSLPRSVAMSIRTGRDWEERQKEAKKKKFGTSEEVGSERIDQDLQGINENTKIIEFDDGSKGVFKYDMVHGTPEGEVVASEFDKSIGWGIVPETIMYTHQGETGSLQEFIPDAQTLRQRKDLKGDVPLQLEQDRARMAVMDSIFDNDDRHMGNYMVSNDNSKLWVIDNGGFFAESIKDLYFPVIPSAQDMTIMKGWKSPTYQAWGEVASWVRSGKADQWMKSANMTSEQAAKSFSAMLEATNNYEEAEKL